jgi:hypothetical protein
MDGFSVTLFKTLYFGMILFVLGCVYVMSTDLLSSKIEHIIVVLSIVLFAAAIATLVGNSKVLSDVANFESNNPLGQDQEYYLKYMSLLKGKADSMRVTTQVLESEVEKLNEMIDTRSPIIVETIVHVPGEIIYVNERVDRENDEEDDDDD